MVDIKDLDFGPAKTTTTSADSGDVKGGGRGGLDNAPDDGDLVGAAKNFATSAIKGVSHIPGVYGDIRDFGKYLAHSAIGTLEGKSAAEVAAELKAREGKQFPKSMTEHLPSGRTFSDPALQITGEYEPTSEWGKVGAAGVETGLSMLAPGAGPGKAVINPGRFQPKVSSIRAPAPELAKEILTGGAKAIPLGTIGGAGGEYTAEHLGPGAGTAVGLALPTILGMGHAKLRQATDPMRGSKQQGIADKRFLDQTKDVEGSLDKLRAEPDTSLAPTADVTGDIGHAQAEKVGTTHDPKFAGRMEEIKGAQNQQRQGELASLGPIGARPEDVSRGYQEHLEQLEAGRDAAHAALPDARPADVTGGELRTDTKNDKGYFQRGLSQLYQSVDPDGVMAVVTKGPRDTAAKIIEGNDPRYTVASPIAAPIAEMVSKLGDVTKLSDLTKLDQTVTAAMKQAGKTGDTGYHQLVEIKGSIKEAINKAIENQHEFEQGAVQRGEMTPEETLAHKLAEHRAAHYARQGRDLPRAVAAADGAAGQAGVSGVSGAGGQGRPGDRAGAAGVPGDEPRTPNMGAEAAERLALANQGYGAFSRTFKAGPVADKLKTSGFADQHPSTDASVAQSAFKAGDNGYENAQAWLRATLPENRPQRVQLLKEIATDRLYGAMKNDVLDQKTLDAWRQKHGSALRAIDEISPGFSQQFNTAAGAHEAVQNYQKSTAARFLDVAHPDEVVSRLGRMMQADNGPSQIGALMHQASTMPNGEAIIAGLRKAGAEHLKRDLSNAAIMPDGTRGTPVLSAAGFADFMAKHQDVLHVMYEPEAVSRMNALAADMQRSQLVDTMQRVKGGSDTAANLVPLIQEAVAHAQKQGSSVGSMLNLAAAGELLHGSGWHAAALAAGNRVLEAANHMLIGARGRGLSRINDLFMEGLADPKVARLMLERAIDAQGRPNTTAFAQLRRALMIGEHEGQQSDRPQRAAGGKVSTIDHAAKAAALVRRVAEVRNATSKRTEPLLKLPDATVTQALSIANRELGHG